MDDKNIWTKRIPIINSNGINQESNIIREIQLQKISSTYGFTPPILNVSVNRNSNSNEYIIQMEKIDGECLANSWGDKPTDIPENFFHQIRCIVKLLFFREGIEYIDITPYNFLEKNGRIYLIDFGHAYFTPVNPQNSNKSKITPTNWFLKEFITSEINEYNPDFK